MTVWKSSKIENSRKCELRSLFSDPVTYKYGGWLTDDLAPQWRLFCVRIHSNSSIILGVDNANVPRILAIIADVCAEDALEDNEQVYLRLLSIARHVQVQTTEVYQFVVRSQASTPSFCCLQYEKRGKAWMDLSRDACCGWCHVQSAHVWVCSLPFTLLSLNSVRSFCSVCPASLIATGSIVASYST